MSTHENSVTSFATERANGRLSQRASAVYDAICASNRPLSDREIAGRLGYTDLNAVRPRITELIEAGLIAESGSIICDISGKRVRVSRALSLAEITEARRQKESELQASLAL